MKKTQIKKEERNLEDSIFGDAWPLENKSKLAVYQEAAARHLVKDARLNIRVSSADLRLIKDKAAKEGIPYQSMISGLIHKFVRDRLVDRQQIEMIVQAIK